MCFGRRLVTQICCVHGMVLDVRKCERVCDLKGINYGLFTTRIWLLFYRLPNFDFLPWIKIPSFLIWLLPFLFPCGYHPSLEGPKDGNWILLVLLGLNNNSFPRKDHNSARWPAIKNLVFRFSRFIGSYYIFSFFWIKEQYNHISVLIISS